MCAEQGVVWILTIVNTKCFNFDFDYLCCFIFFCQVWLHMHVSSDSERRRHAAKMKTTKLNKH